MAKADQELFASEWAILEAVWESGEEGATVAEIWREISKERPVGRTTILNLVDRLEKRDWLTRRQAKGVYRYRAAMDREKTAHTLASEFVDDFFGGRASDLVLSLLGKRRINKDEVERLRKLVDKASPATKRRKEK